MIPTLDSRGRAIPVLLALPCLVVLGGCPWEVRLGGKLDPGRAQGSFEECGNGIDDDGDGTIDEGCPCGNGETQVCYSGRHPERQVGLCADGQQRCDAEGSTEFGQWGLCRDDVRPGEQQCDGLDEDCDGAIDEGCPCAEGDTRACATDYTLGPCRAGAQRCTSNGTWSACEGAVGPRPEVCEDRIDNDCDGLADDGCDCDPVPEVCGDGLDNDCDGVVDEAACATALPDGGVPAATWGEYAGLLPVALCFQDLELVVDTTDSTSDGDATLDDPADAGPTLSLTEALIIASNRAGPQTITFDPTVFPAHAPSAIDFACGDRLDAVNTCIDARDRGVILRWPGSFDCRSLFSLREGSRAIGLTILHLPWSLSVLDDSQLAGCRLNTDGHGVFPGDSRYDVAAVGGVVGPGNVFVGESGLLVHGASATRIVGNYFGHDPVSGTLLGLDRAIEVDERPTDGETFVAWNSFAIPENGHLFYSTDAASRIVFRQNYVGTHPSGEPLPGDWEGVRIPGLDGTFTIGPANIIRGVRVGIEVTYDSAHGRWPQVRVTQNRIYETGTGIRFLEPPAAPVGAPSITAVGDGEVSGSCPGPGTVELFHDAGDQGEVFLGRVDCDGVEPFTAALESPVPSGRNVTATLTTADGAHTSSFSAPFPVP